VRFGIIESSDFVEEFIMLENISDRDLLVIVCLDRICATIGAV
jgi:hypothetical protein